MFTHNREELLGGYQSQLWRRLGHLPAAAGTNPHPASTASSVIDLNLQMSLKIDGLTEEFIIHDFLPDTTSETPSYVLQIIVTSPKTKNEYPGFVDFKKNQGKTVTLKTVYKRAPGKPFTLEYKGVLEIQAQAPEVAVFDKTKFSCVFTVKISHPMSVLKGAHSSFYFVDATLKQAIVAVLAKHDKTEGKDFAFPRSARDLLERKWGAIIQPADMNDFVFLQTLAYLAGLSLVFALDKTYITDTVAATKEELAAKEEFSHMQIISDASMRAQINSLSEAVTRLDLNRVWGLSILPASNASENLQVLGRDPLTYADVESALNPKFSKDSLKISRLSYLSSVKEVDLTKDFLSKWTEFKKKERISFRTSLLFAFHSIGDVISFETTKADYSKTFNNAALAIQDKYCIESIVNQGTYLEVTAVSYLATAPTFYGAIPEAIQAAVMAPFSVSAKVASSTGGIAVDATKEPVRALAGKLGEIYVVPTIHVSGSGANKPLITSVAQFAFVSGVLPIGVPVTLFATILGKPEAVPFFTNTDAYNRAVSETNPNQVYFGVVDPKGLNPEGLSIVHMPNDKNHADNRVKLTADKDFILQGAFESAVPSARIQITKKEKKTVLSFLHKMFVKKSVSTGTDSEHIGFEGVNIEGKRSYQQMDQNGVALVTEAKRISLQAINGKVTQKAADVKSSATNKVIVDAGEVQVYSKQGTTIDAQSGPLEFNGAACNLKTISPANFGMGNAAKMPEPVELITPPPAAPAA